MRRRTLTLLIGLAAGAGGLVAALLHRTPDWGVTPGSVACLLADAGARPLEWRSPAGDRVVLGVSRDLRWVHGVVFPAGGMGASDGGGGMPLAWGPATSGWGRVDTAGTAAVRDDGTRAMADALALANGRWTRSLLRLLPKGERWFEDPSDAPRGTSRCAYRGRWERPTPVRWDALPQRATPVSGGVPGVAGSVRSPVANVAWNGRGVAFVALRKASASRVARERLQALLAARGWSTRRLAALDRAIARYRAPTRWFSRADGSAVPVGRLRDWPVVSILGPGEPRHPGPYYDRRGWHVGDGFQEPELHWQLIRELRRLGQTAGPE